MNLVPRRFLGGAAVIALVAGACAGGGSSAAPSSAAPASQGASQPASAPASQGAKPVTIEWWHISTGDPGKTIWQDAANAYMAKHPNVKINITILENEAFKTKLQTTMQSGKVPDLFQSWGGGTMAEQADAGLLQDITAAVQPWASEMEDGAMKIYQYKGKQYGIPWDIGIIGFWYNKTLFQQAGITNTPTTWTELLSDIDKLKAKNIVPYALAGKDKWPGMHLWSYLVLRSGGSDALASMVQSGNWNQDACIQGGTLVQQLVAKNPFQPGFLNAVYDKGEAAAMGNGQAAMELMGQWAPAVEIQNAKNGKGIGDALGWFPFPGVDGGKGDPSDAIGGGNGVAVGKDAPPEAIDFLHYLVSPEVANKVGGGPNLDGKDSFGIPVTKAAEASVKDPLMQLVIQGRAKAKFVQLYLDQFLPSATGAAINDATAGLFAKTKTPQQVCQALTDASKKQ